MKAAARRATNASLALERLVRSCRWAREVGSLGVITFLPLVFNPYSEQPFELAKVIFFRWAVSALVWLFLLETLLGLWNRFQSADSSSRVGWRLFKGNRLARPILAYAGIHVLATLFSDDPQQSLWGGSDKHGTSTLLVTLVFFFLVADNLRNKGQIDRVIKALLLGTVPVALYAMVQSIGLDPLLWVSDSISPALSTMGRSNFLGAYLAMAVPFALVPIFVRGSVRYVTLVLVLVACVFLSQARAAWLALTLGLLVLFVLLAHRRRSRTLWCVSLLVLTLGMSGQVFLGHVHLTIRGGESIGRTFGDRAYSELRSGTVVSRLVIWRNTLPIVGDRWLLGYGPESFDSIYNSRYPSDLSLGGLGMRVDDAHNLLLSHLVSAGTAGLAAFLVVTGLFFSLTVRALHHVTNPFTEVLCAAILASATIFLIQAQFNPDVIVTWVFYWVVLAMSTAIPVKCPQ